MPKGLAWDWIRTSDLMELLRTRNFKTVRREYTIKPNKTPQLWQTEFKKTNKIMQCGGRSLNNCKI